LIRGFLVVEKVSFFFRAEKLFNLDLLEKKATKKLVSPAFTPEPTPSCSTRSPFFTPGPTASKLAKTYQVDAEERLP